MNISGGRSTSYSYDSLNRLIGVAGAPAGYTFEYDVLGHRMAIVRDGKRSEFVIDPFGNPVSEYAGTGQVVAHYTYGLALTSRVDAAGNAAYYDFDAIGSTTGLTGIDGLYVNRYSYLPFGETLSAVESIPNPFRYVGAFGVQDDQNGLNFMRARFYSSAQGRFTQPDPIGVAGGINLYTYVANNPVSLADPSGTTPFVLPAWQDVVMAVRLVLAATDLSGTTGLPTYGPPVDPVVKWGETARTVERAQDAARALRGSQRGFTNPEFMGYVLGFTALAAELFIIGQQSDILGHYIATGEVRPCIEAIPRIIQFNCGAIPVINGSGAGNTNTVHVAPKDPNYISGPGAFGTDNLIPGNIAMPYIIGFENQPNARAPAQRIVITETLDPNLDVSTFQLGDFGFGTFNVHVPPGRQFFSSRIDARSSRGVFVDVTAAFNGRVVTWTFNSIDPATQKPPLDPEVGFLPPDQTPPNGEGYVTYFVRLTAGLASGTQIQAQAGIVFDTNGSVATNLFVDTIAPSAIQCTGCYFLVDGVRATVAFNVSATGGTSIFTYNFRNATQTVQLTGTTISQLTVSGNTVTFAGPGSLNGQAGYNFIVTAKDGGGAGSGQDTISISITGPNNYSSSAAGTVAGGDIVIKE